MRPTAPFRIWRLAAAAVLTALAACSESTAEPEEPLASRYLLTRLGTTSDPMVVGEHTYASGTYQVYTMAYDSLTLGAGAQARRSYMMVMFTRSHDGASVAPLALPVARNARVIRQGQRVIFEYDQTASRMRPDTFAIRGTNLVKQGPYGVVCSGCPPVRQVEYVYVPR